MVGLLLFGFGIFILIIFIVIIIVLQIISPDYTKNTFLLIFELIGIIILIVLLTSSWGIYKKLVSVSNEIQTKLDKTNESLTKLNSNIQGLEQLNQQISAMKESINSINQSVSTLPNNTQSLLHVQNNLIQIKKELNTLSQIYPNQTVVLNNVNEDNLNTIINNAVNLEFKEIEWKTNFNFILNIIFGGISIFSLGGLAIYFIYKRSN